MPRKHTVHAVAASARSTSRSTTPVPVQTNFVTERSRTAAWHLAAATGRCARLGGAYFVTGDRTRPVLPATPWPAGVVAWSLPDQGQSVVSGEVSEVLDAERGERQAARATQASGGAGPVQDFCSCCVQQMRNFPQVTFPAMSKGSQRSIPRSLLARVSSVDEAFLLVVPL